MLGVQKIQFEVATRDKEKIHIDKDRLISMNIKK